MILRRLRVYVQCIIDSPWSVNVKVARYSPTSTFGYLARPALSVLSPGLCYAFVPARRLDCGQLFTDYFFPKNVFEAF